MVFKPFNQFSTHFTVASIVWEVVLEGDLNIVAYGYAKVLGKLIIELDLVSIKIERREVISNSNENLFFRINECQCLANADFIWIFIGCDSRAW